MAVERSRGRAIPAGHLHVLYMLIDYSERAFQLLRRPQTDPERADLYDVFRRIGEGLAIPELPETYDAWREDRRLHMERDLAYSDLTTELYGRYRRHLGWWRYETLLRVQSTLVPDHVRRLLALEPCRLLRPTLRAYGPWSASASARSSTASSCRLRSCPGPAARPCGRIRPRLTSARWRRGP